MSRDQRTAMSRDQRTAMARGQRTAGASNRLPMFKVFVTRLHLDTTDEHVRHYVREATGEDPVGAVHRIAPREGQLRVVQGHVPPEAHGALLLPETWPQYSRFREFVEKVAMPPPPVQRTAREQRLRAQWK
ncbi:hypothetical protein C7M84_000244 [Penaeus vannamei]|uniref:Uncharacterized protein n=1 Tax=Penaeus vannamei TaxID=6689 RepID=A0A3R7PSA6_PENVA|nr:uncharacterized protein LOC113829863 [Penaeus vannamei]ROT81016.1 hypothetical protein C7M84_000244 [Penaeus vannamei]